MVELIEILFGMWNRVGSRNCVRLGQDPPTGTGTCEGDDTGISPDAAEHRSDWPDVGISPHAVDERSDWPAWK